MYYFRFEIPTNPDGSVVNYSLGWHGTMPKCPRGAEVLLYQNKEKFGIAKTEDEFVPPEVKVIPEDIALEIICKAIKDKKLDMSADIFVGDTFDAQWLVEDGIVEPETFND